MANAVKQLIFCKNFRLRELMALTEQIFIEILDFIIRMFNELDKYPKVLNAAKMCLDQNRYFYRTNFQASYLHLVRSG